MSKTVRRVLMAGLVAFVVYPFSYAPLYRLINDGSRARKFAADAPQTVWETAYQPIMLLIDSPYPWLSTPLLSWGDLWGVGASMRVDSMVRVPFEARPPLLPSPDVPDEFRSTGRSKPVPED